ncbi:MAG: hypothetical protein HXY40_18100 [Chloroflexi bacterium]|nr:hypothetical protein [Chloroflexota bacterium]
MAKSKRDVLGEIADGMRELLRDFERLLNPQQKPARALVPVPVRKPQQRPPRYR